MESCIIDSGVVGDAARSAETETINDTEGDVIGDD